MSMDATTLPASPTARLRAIALVAGMALGSVVLWLGIPAFWVLVAGQISKSGSPAMGPIALVLIASPISMVLFAPVLGRIDHAHRRLRGALRSGPRRAAWNKSMRDSTTTVDDGVLEQVMIVSVVVALAAVGGWIALFGQMSMPG